MNRRPGLVRDLGRRATCCCFELLISVFAYPIRHGPSITSNNLAYELSKSCSRLSLGCVSESGESPPVDDSVRAAASNPELRLPVSRSSVRSRFEEYAHAAGFDCGCQS